MNTPARPTWTILIATLGQRAHRLKRLLDGLLPQVEPYAGAVRVCAFYNNGERPLSEVRQDLIDAATTDYISFIDDDDEVPDYFVDEVYSRLGDVDYIGWQLQCYVDGVPLRPTYHSLRYDGWSDDSAGFYRDISHLNPIRTELARCVSYRGLKPPEDVSWASLMRDHVVTEAYVDRIMYHYHASSTDSTWEPGTVKPGRFQVLLVVDPNFSYHPGSTFD